MSSNRSRPVAENTGGKWKTRDGDFYDEDGALIASSNCCQRDLIVIHWFREVQLFIQERMRLSYKVSECVSQREFRAKSIV